MGCGASKAPAPGTTVDVKPEAAAPPAQPTAPPAERVAPAQTKAAPADPPPSAETAATTAPTPDPAPARSGGATTAVFIFGHDVSQKMEICTQMKDSLDCVYLQTTEMLRNEMKAGTELGTELADMIKQGKIVPQHKMASLIQVAMADGGVYLVDGFPKSYESFDSFAEQMRCERQLALYFELSDDELTSRIGMSDTTLNAEAAARKAKMFKNQTQDLLTRLSEKGLLETIPAADSGSAAARALDLVRGLQTSTPAPAAGQPTAAADVPTGGAAAGLTNKCVFVLGGPGSGKGTQCQKLIDGLGCTHLSAGDLLRQEVATGSEQGKAIAEMIKEGKIVPAQTTIDLLKAAMAAAPSGSIVLIDGFPRSLDNLAAFEAQVGMCELTLFLTLSAEAMEARIIERGKTSGRTDDNVETLKKRFDTFTTQSVPVVEELRKKTTVVEVDAAASIDEVYASIEAEMRKLL